MTEWGVVGVFITLIGLFGAIFVLTDRINKPVKDLTRNVVELTIEMKNLNQKLDRLDATNEIAHGSIMERLGHIGDIVGDHETRITVLETKGGVATT